MSLQERQAELVDTHRAVQAEDLSYVLVGGWAVSVFQTRFTTDVDMVIPETELDAYDGLLTDLGYSKAFENDVANVYEGRIVRYEKAVGDNAVEFDALVGALRCRQTDAEWSYRYLHEHSSVESLEVAESLTARIPNPALLFALKLHSGRLADARDLVIVGFEADLDSIEQHIHRGNPNQLAEQIERVLAELESDEFADSFKGVFQQTELPEDNIDALIEFLRTQLDRL
ncbi:hypothetical protein [Halapricum desulfuricans]|uniref:Putative nucleotidyltransferase n=1 Tax=Halapricum desulfuricans TaxID=2841257 RepID=A0A897N1H3_9EURY|nr:hypothetical protein [Halapricum desulfuricans]QSG04545.1 putative nucleotidyltransferase [Halapricum desulfuricans]